MPLALKNYDLTDDTKRIASHRPWIEPSKKNYFVLGGAGGRCVVINAPGLKEKLEIDKSIDDSSCITNATFYPSDNNLILVGRSNGRCKFLKKAKVALEWSSINNSSIDRIIALENANKIASVGKYGKLNILSPETDVLVNEFNFIDETYDYSKMIMIDEESNGNLLALSHGKSL